MARLSSNDRWLDWGVRIVAALVVGALAFLAYTVYQGQSRAQGGSLAARAIANLEQAVKDNPDNPDVRILLGDAYRDTGRPAEAIKWYKEALELGPNHPVALSGLALVAMQQEEWRTAEGYWQQTIEVLRKNQFAAQDLRLEKAYYYYGTVLIQVAEYEDAIAYLKEALRIKRSDADTHYALSVAYGKIGSLSNQRSSLATALLFVPTMPEANYDFGLLLLADGDEAGAAEHFRRAVDNAPGRREPLDELVALGPFEKRMAEAESLAGRDPEAALLEARIAAALDPEDVGAMRLVARLLQEVGDPADAKAAWQHVLNTVPDDPEATAALAALDAES
jgi:tetratricopeptide (TPR) repeat protein